VGSIHFSRAREGSAGCAFLLLVGWARRYEVVRTEAMRDMLFLLDRCGGLVRGHDDGGRPMGFNPIGCPDASMTVRIAITLITIKAILT